MRLDLFLLYTNRVKSRTFAKNLIQLGKIIVDGKIETKASANVKENSEIIIDNENIFASLGGIKLSTALITFDINVNNLIALDIGCSNGGFTDVLLKNGAQKVYALDVGACALDKELIDNPKVIVKERINARFLAYEDIGEKVDIIVTDVSFISLKLIIPPAIKVLKAGGIFVGLIKPQFECGKSNLSKSGIVTKQEIRDAVVADIISFSKSLGLHLIGITEAPHPFPDKNQEYLIACKTF